MRLETCLGLPLGCMVAHEPGRGRRAPMGSTIPALMRRKAVFEPGTRIEMTKGYRGVKGVIAEKTDSPFELYVIRLDNGIHLAAGPAALRVEEHAE